jgi:lambda family phage portal protein
MTARSVRAKVKRSYPADALSARRWEAAKTHRLNQAHWQNAREQSVNVDLQDYLATLRTRCTYERDNNPLVDGIVFTHYVDIVGRDGPELQVQSDSSTYNEWLEAHWRKWFKAPTPNPKVSGAALLRLWVQSLWRAGEFLAQKVTAKADSLVQMRLRPIHPRRLATPMAMAGRDDIVMGIQFSREGEPQRYFIQEEQAFGTLAYSTETASIPPDDIVHFFLLREEDQARGFPWLGSSLPSTADLRDYDAETLESARQAANLGVYWHTVDPNAPYLDVNEQETLERGTQSTGPPGWQPKMLTPQQPTTQYSEFHDERLREVGRPVAMPLMVIKLDAGQHNYSSARFDGRNYDRACEVIQCAISGTAKATGPLSELVDDVDREAGLYERAQRMNPPERPEEVTYEWTWSRPPQVDREKESAADRADMEMMIASPQDIAAARGTTLDTLIAKLQRANEKLEAAGLPPIPMILPKGSAYARRGDLKAAATDGPTPVPGDATDSEDVEETDAETVSSND